MLQVGTRLGPYDIVSQLGAGGMGVVYRARDERLGREVAVKVLPDEVRNDPERLRRFEAESRAVGALNHPNVLVVYDVGAQDGTPYLVTELLEGETLRSRLRQGPLGWRKAVELAAQAAHGLAAAHERGLVHRDIKPDNLFITRDGRLKILDFGLARATPGTAAAAAGTLSETADGKVLGTAGYMAPEQVRGLPADHRSDVFALGSVLYESLSGGPAFGGDTPVERGYAVLSRDIPALAPRLPDAPVGLERLVRRCLEKSPGERYQSARDLAFALEGLLQDSNGQVVTRPEPPVATAPQKSSLWAWTGFAAVVGLTAIALSVLGGPDAPAATQAEQPRYTRITYRRGTVDFARFSPDGRTVYYQSTSEAAPRAVYAATPGSPESRQVGPSPAGLLAVSRTGELALALPKKSPVDRGQVLGRLAPGGGAPRESLAGVNVADYRPDGQLVVVRELEGRMALESPPGKSLTETPGYFSRVRVSPDGRYAAVLDHPVMGDDRGTVEVVDLDSGERERLSGPWYSVWGLAWSADGHEVWFTAGDRQEVARSLRAVDLSGNERLLLRVPGNLQLEDVAADGRALLVRVDARLRTAVRRLPDGPEQDLSWFDGTVPVAVSSDGTKLLFNEGLAAAGEEQQVWIRPLDGGAATHLSRGLGRALSPDGAWAAVSPKEPFATLSLVPTGPGEPRELPAGDFAQIGGVVFTADGQQLALVANRAGEGRRAWLQDLDGGAPRALSEPGLLVAVPPDAAGRVPIIDRDEKAAILHLPDGRIEPLPRWPARVAPVRWQPDGGRVVAARVPEPGHSGGPTELLLVDPATGQTQPYASISPTGGMTLERKWRDFLLSPDTTLAAYSYGAHECELYLVEGLK